MKVFTKVEKRPARPVSTDVETQVLALLTSGVSQGNVARRVGISQAAVWRIARRGAS